MFFSYVLFSFIPTFMDIIIGAIFLTTTFDFRFTLITLNTIILYLATVAMAHKWKRTLRKDMNKAEDAFRAIGVDSLLNFETVKYYNAEEYETDRYRAALLKSQHTDWLWTASYHYIHAVEKVITRGGLLAGALLCAFLISKEEDGLTVGDYVLFASYTQKLISPLNYLQYMF
uniref:ABC transmembrane type-1 domain-containing protein n=1 Tax=Plectus sambesii TaxID=2011161 RepID=A0A914V398_9BILA